MHKSTEEANNLVNGFCNPYNALFVSQNSQETNESINADHYHEHETTISEDDLNKKDGNYQDLITADLLKQIESNSPIRSDKQTLPKLEHSKFFLQSSGEHASPINANGNYPSFFPKKTNLWKHGTGRLQPLMYPFKQEGQFPIVNDRYIQAGGPRPYYTPKNQCLTFANVNEKGWVCVSCQTLNSESKPIRSLPFTLVRNQCYRCNCLRMFPSMNYAGTSNSSIVNNSPTPLMSILPMSEQRKAPVQIPSPNATPNQNEGTSINLTLREIAQINQMQYNQLKKINQLKELQANEKEKKYNTPVLSSSLKEKFESSLGSANPKKKKKPFAERAGDWVCVKCKNLNFSFRSACNRCHISKSDNDKLYEQYMNNLMNYCKVNDILQLKYSSPNTSFPQWIAPSSTGQNNDGLVNSKEQNNSSQEKRNDAKEEN